MKKITLTLLLFLAVLFAQAQAVFINELHYDNTGGDVDEGFEIAGPSGTDLTGWKVELYNGSNGTDYGTINLSGAIPDEGAGFGALGFFASGIQNGAPDGLALIDAANTVIQFLSYEGSFTATSGTANGMTSTDIGVFEPSSSPIGESLQLIGTGSLYGDFTWSGPTTASSGLINTGQTFVGSGSGSSPTITCPADITVNNAAGTCGAEVSFTGFAMDAEDGNISSSIIATPASGSTFPVGVNTVTLSVTDSDNNTATCQFTITVVDNEAPVAICQNITIELDPITGTATIDPTEVDNGSSDLCGAVSLSLDVSSFDCSMTGANTVILTVTDNAGNSSTCTATVTVQDTTAPIITCLGEASGPSVFINEIHYDNAGTDEGEAIEIAGPSGTNLSTYSIVLYNGNGGTEYNTVNLSGTIDDEGNGFGAVNFEIADIQNGSPDGIVLANNGNVIQFLSYEGSFTAVDGVASGLTSTDIGVSEGSGTPIGESLQLSGTGTYYPDFTWNAPTAATPGTINVGQIYIAPTTSSTDVYLDANGMASVDPNDLLVSVDEACGYTVTAGGVGGGTSGSLSTMFVGTNGGSSGWAVMYDVTVGPADIQVTELDINSTSTSTFDLDLYVINGTYVGNETNAAAWGAVAASGSGVGAGTDIPSNVVLDAPVVLSANTTYGFAVVTTGLGQRYTNGDGTNQNFSNADMSMSLGTAVSGLFTGTVFTPRVWNGTVHYETIASSGLEFTCADLGENIVEVTVTDDSGNTSTCFATVNVIDNIAPILVCQDTTIELGPDGTATVDPNALLATLPTTYEVMVIGSDNQSGNEGFTDFTVNVTEAANVTFDWDFTLNDVPGFDGFGYLLNGTYTQLTDPLLGNQSGSAAVAVAPGDVFGFRAQTDDNLFGNTETVISNFVPGFDGQFDPANWMLTLTESDGDAYFTEIPGGPLSFDACGITVLAVDVTEVSCADIGTPITVTVFASDASGNIASCTSVITVVDLLGPELTCPADQTVDPGAGNLFYILPDYFATGEAIADDNCTDPVTILSQDPAPGTPLPDGTYTITMTATDEYGNVSTCTFELTVETILGVDSNNLDAGLALYPNPADNVVNLVNKTNISLEKMMIYDINGKLVSQTDLRAMQGVKAVDVSSLASGVYMVQIIGDSASTVKRLIKE